MKKYKIGIFDSGFGGLTIFKEIEKALPQYDYIYLGDNSRAPYGSKSFETVYHHTIQCVEWLIQQDCALIIIACNTASARALRTIQQYDLSRYPDYIRVLGVIRPTAEIIGDITSSQHIGILATEGTVNSKTYDVEIHNFYPDITVLHQACKLWVPIIEDNKVESPLMESVIRDDINSLLSQDENIDTILLGCTHFPLVEHIIKKIVKPNINIISQAPIVARSLVSYLDRHKEFDDLLTTDGTRIFYTTDDPAVFEGKASLFLQRNIKATHASVEP